MKTHPQKQTLDLIIAHIQSHFYQDNQKRFFRDRRFLLYVITWPASWLHQRGLHPPPARYQRLLIDRLDAIRSHGAPDQYLPYFPRYLLKCLQDYLAWHGDSLYQELKHIRNALYSLDALLEHFKEQVPPQTPSTSNAQAASNPPRDPHTIEVLAHTHHILKRQYQRKSSVSTTRQLSLF